jgi:hypothetical protein
MNTSHPLLQIFLYGWQPRTFIPKKTILTDTVNLANTERGHSIEPQPYQQFMGHKPTRQT